jgi:hypothetical protein
MAGTGAQLRHKNSSPMKMQIHVAHKLYVGSAMAKARNGVAA